MRALGERAQLLVHHDPVARAEDETLDESTQWQVHVGSNSGDETRAAGIRTQLVGERELHSS